MSVSQPPVEPAAGPGAAPALGSVVDSAVGSVDEDPRVTRSRAVVRAAAREELAAVGLGGFTIDGVAKRAGVGRSTIYRHWGDRLGLVRDAVASISPQPPRSDAGGSSRQRVQDLLRHLVQAMADPATSAWLVALVDAAQRDERVAAIHHADVERRRGALVEALRAVRDAGGARPDLDPEVAATCLSGAVVFRRLMTSEPMDPSEVAALVDEVVGAAPADPAARRQPDR